MCYIWVLNQWARCVLKTCLLNSLFAYLPLYLVCPPTSLRQILHNHFSWVLQSSQEKLKTMLKWKMLGGKQGVLWEMCKILENGSVCFKRIALLLQKNNSKNLHVTCASYHLVHGEINQEIRKISILHSFSPLSLSFPVLSESTLLLLPAVPGDWGYSEVTSSTSGTL